MLIFALAPRKWANFKNIHKSVSQAQLWVWTADWMNSSLSLWWFLDIFLLYKGAHFKINLWSWPNVCCYRGEILQDLLTRLWISYCLNVQFNCKAKATNIFAMTVQTQPLNIFILIVLISHMQWRGSRVCRWPEITFSKNDEIIFNGVPLESGLHQTNYLKRGYLRTIIICEREGGWEKELGMSLI